eukprot:7749249-Pyramimonas_sp.AAC.1
MEGETPAKSSRRELDPKTERPSASQPVSQSAASHGQPADRRIEPNQLSEMTKNFKNDKMTKIHLSPEPAAL